MPSPKRKLPVWDQAAREADLVLELPGRIPMFFRRIPAGSFRMGSRGFYPDEEPIHRVVIAREFYLGTFVVTQEQYRAVAERCPALREAPSPSEFKGARRPVENVSWYDATAFCQWLARWKGLPKEIGGVRLPTEAEWEYACRAGSETEYYHGEGEAALAEVAWCDQNSGNQTYPVDERPEEHPFGLHGMHGNVWEWCQDVFDAQAYRKRVDGWEAREWTLADAGDDALYWSLEHRKRQEPGPRPAGRFLEQHRRVLPLGEPPRERAGCSQQGQRLSRLSGSRSGGRARSAAVKRTRGGAGAGRRRPRDEAGVGRCRLGRSGCTRPDASNFTSRSEAKIFAET